jgi:hypothetical protein
MVVWRVDVADKGGDNEHNGCTVGRDDIAPLALSTMGMQQCNRLCVGGVGGRSTDNPFRGGGI